jgi:methyl-accepting chemotaxis protein
MFESQAARRSIEQVQAMNRSQAVIEFAMDGTILTANENFLTCLGYTLAEIEGKHHSIFVDPADLAQSAYQEFWNQLNAGVFQSAQYKRIAKGGKEIWIQASYNPVIVKGRATRVIKFATDITSQKMRDLEAEGKIAAMSKAQASSSLNSMELSYLQMTIS